MGECVLQEPGRLPGGGIAPFPHWGKESQVSVKTTPSSLSISMCSASELVPGTLGCRLHMKTKGGKSSSPPYAAGLGRGGGAVSGPHLSFFPAYSRYKAQGWPGGLVPTTDRVHGSLVQTEK